MPAWTIAIMPAAVLVLAALILLAIGRWALATRFAGVFGLCAIVAALLLLGQQTAAWLSPTTASSSTSIAAADASRFLSADRFSLTLQWCCLLLGLLLGAVAYGASKGPSGSTHFARLLLSLAGTLLTCVAGDLIVLFLALELSMLPLMLPPARSPEDAVQTSPGRGLAISLLSSALLLYGFAALYGISGAMELKTIRSVLASAAGNDGAALLAARAVPLGTVALVLIFAGLGMRLGVVPFHFGRAELLDRSSACAFDALVTLPRLAAFVGLLRGPCACLAGFEPTGQWLVWVLAAASMIVGSTRALAETRLQRKLAYLALAHSGLALVGISVGFWEVSHVEYSLDAGPSLPGGWRSSLGCFVCHLSSLAGLCAVLAYLHKADGRIEHIDELQGIARSQPVAALCALVFLLSLAGVPPLPGFWGNLLVLAATASVPAQFSGELIPAPAPGFVLLGLLAVLSLFGIAASCLQIVGKLYLEPQIARPRPAGGRSALAAAVVTAVVTLVSGLLPFQLIGSLGRLDVGQQGAAGSAEQAAPSGREEMETTGLEPATSAVQGRRSPN